MIEGTMLSKKDEDTLKALEASLRADETFSKSSTKLLTRIDKRGDKAVGIKRGIACILVGLGLLFASVFLNIFILALAAGVAVTAGVYLAVPWQRLSLYLTARLSKYEQSFFSAMDKKKAAKKKSSR